MKRNQTSNNIDMRNAWAIVVFWVIAVAAPAARGAGTGIGPRMVVHAAIDEADSTGSLPRHVPGEVLVRIKDGTDIGYVMAGTDLPHAAISRTLDPGSAAEGLRGLVARERGADGLYRLEGRVYRDAGDIPEAELFKEAYGRMGHRQRALYRSYRVSLPPGLSVP